MKLTNRQCSKYARNHQPFKNSNGTMFGEWINDIYYVVYSYGYHWPLTVYDARNGMYYVNASRYGVTTSKHAGLVNPIPASNVLYTNTDELISMIRQAREAA